MKYYRHIDRTQVQFGFLYFKDIKEKTYESEIKELGGECFLIERPTKTPRYVRYVNNLMKNHFWKLKKKQFFQAKLHTFHSGYKSE